MFTNKERNKVRKYLTKVSGKISSAKHKNSDNNIFFNKSKYFVFTTVNSQNNQLQKIFNNKLTRSSSSNVFVPGTLRESKH